MIFRRNLAKTLLSKNCFVLVENYSVFKVASLSFNCSVSRNYHSHYLHCPPPPLLTTASATPIKIFSRVATGGGCGSKGQHQHFQIVLNEVQPQPAEAASDLDRDPHLHHHLGRDPDPPPHPPPLKTESNDNAKMSVSASSNAASSQSATATHIQKPPHPARLRKPSTSVLWPPSRKGMLTLDRSAFDKEVKIPTVYVFEDCLNPNTLQKFKKFMLKIQGVKPVQNCDDDKDGDLSSDLSEKRKVKKIFINPELLKGHGQDLLKNLVQHEIQPDPSIISSLGYECVKLTYENWTLTQVMDAILPDDDDKVAGFSQIGPIIHLNLREHVIPYKEVIGQVFLDKISNAKTVVNKTNTIDTKFRNFQMELLAGDPNTVVSVKENRCEFEFDFATVYWNPRLGSEHDRLVKVIGQGDILYDVFAGVGPFTIPAAKKKVTVLANDLNPDSFRWLEHNVKKNKVTGCVQCFNIDGRQFIREVASHDLKKRIVELRGQTQGPAEPKRFHFVMNLPAMAVDFLDAFWGILEKIPEVDGPEAEVKVPEVIVIVHVYCFIKDTEKFKEKAVNLVKDRLNFDLQQKDGDDSIVDVAFVRNVAPNKEMLRVSFKVPREVLGTVKDNLNCGKVNDHDADTENSRKRKISEVEDI